MKFLMKVKKGKPKLYELYKIESSKKNIEMPTTIVCDKDTVDKDVVPDRVKREGVRRKTKNMKRKEIILPDKMTISISSLEGRTGCSHMALTLAAYVSSKGKRVCIVDYKKENVLFAERNSIPIYPKSKLDDLFDEYDYIILDISNKVKDTVVFSDIKRSRVKIVMADVDKEHIEQLGLFIEKHKDIGSYKWVYIFNQIPKEKVKKVNDLMEDFEHYCVPTFDEEHLSEEIKIIFQELFKNK